MQMPKITKTPQKIKLSGEQRAELEEFLNSDKIEAAFADALCAQGDAAAGVIRAHFLDEDGNVTLPATDVALEETLRAFTRNVLAKEDGIGSRTFDDVAELRRSFDRIASDIYAITEVEPQNPLRVEEVQDVQSREGFTL